jgi:hypothetical protein
MADQQKKSSTVTATKTGKKNTVKCMGCDCTLDDDHLGIRCPSGHHMCFKNAQETAGGDGSEENSCSLNYILSVVLSDPNNNLPPKCPICKVRRRNSAQSANEKQL